MSETTTGNTTGNMTGNASGGVAGVIPNGVPTSNGSDWTSGLNDDLKGYAQNKGFKDPGAVVDSYRNLEKLMGTPKERLLTLPEKEEDPAWSDVYNRLGRPEKAEEYQLPVPEGDKGEFAKVASSWSHELGLSKKQAQGMATKYNEYFSQQMEAQQTQQKTQIEAEDQALKKEWGAAYEQNISLGKRAAQTFGISAEKIDQMEKMVGFTDIMKLMQNIGARIGEDKFVSSDQKNSGFGNILSPEAAKSRINGLKNDPDFVRRYTAGEMAAKDEFENLHKWAHPDSA